jgi:hypothetical protein
MGDFVPPLTIDDALKQAEAVVTDMDTGLRIKDDAFVTARDAAIAVPVSARSMSHPAWVGLCLALERIHVTAPDQPGDDSAKGAADTNGAGKAQKQDIPPSAASNGMVYVCIAISLLLMFLVGTLSRHYTNGVSLLAEIEALAAVQPDRKFGQLERQLLAAQEQLFANVDTSGTDQPTADADELARESSYVILHELRDLNSRVTSLEQRFTVFLIEADSPVPGVGKLVAALDASWNSAKEMLLSLWNSVASFGAIAPSSAQETAKTGVSLDLPESKGHTEERPNDKPAMKVACEPFVQQSDRAGTAATDNPQPGITAATENRPFMLGMNMNKIYAQACKYSLSYVSMAVPSVDLWAITIRGLLAPYSTWILPSLYAALGCMLFFMRAILDDSQKNPSPSKIAHRVALAALAGMILAWFWEPTMGANDEFRAVGFGLFTFAFVVGFSIELFFALLDRLVRISDSAINRLGAS